VIIAYLEKTKPEPALYPSDPGDYARALWFEEYGDGGLAPIVGPKIFFEKFVGPHVFKRPTGEAVVSKAVNEELPPMYDYLEASWGLAIGWSADVSQSPTSESQRNSSNHACPGFR
jgi:glutathione S-transferase